MCYNVIRIIGDDMSKYKKYSMLMCSVGLMLLLAGVTYSFFNYTRTGNSNNFSVGRINFVSRNEETISLNNLFPIDPEESGIMNDSTKVGTYEIDIVGDTDYADGIEYLVSITDANIYTSSGKTIPISLNITPNGLGNENSNYFTARESKDTMMYKRLGSNTIVGDGMIMVGFIKPNTTQGTAEGVNGSITIKAYLDENNIAVSDTYDGTESNSNGTTNDWVNGRTVLTTTEWNNLSNTGISFKVKVEAQEGIWVLGSLEEIMRRNAVMDNTTSTYVSAATGIDFVSFASDTNGKGVYTRAGTENDTYPIVYYRGDVIDNNVFFANKCWKTVRTTDTGGVKLIYNGELSPLLASLAETDYTIVSNTGNFIFDSSDNTWTRTITGNDGTSISDTLEISFNVPAGDDYQMQISGVTSTAGSVSLTIYKGTSVLTGTGNGAGGALLLLRSYGTLTASDVIKMTYYGNGTSESPAIIKVKMVKPDSTLGMGCDNKASESLITINSANTFSFSGTNMGDSMAYNGYMWGDVYQIKQKSNSSPSAIKYGSGYEYNNGTYTLTDASDGFANSRHYTCFNTTGTCTGNVNYVIYHFSSGDDNYLELQNGVTIEEAIQKMQTNTNNSNAKDKIDTWYVANLSSYTSKLEDTIWCNDRSIGDYGGWNQQGNGAFLRYSPDFRVKTLNDVPPTNPTLVCANKNDRFTVNNTNGNRALTHPIALLTSDEIRLAGINGYLKSGGASYWTMTPSSIYNNSVLGFSVTSYGLSDSYGITPSHGLRPSISIKPGQLITKGTGTVEDPYVIE
jgi:hypothetical protein